MLEGNSPGLRNKSSCGLLSNSLVHVDRLARIGSAAQMVGGLLRVRIWEESG